MRRILLVLTTMAVALVAASGVAYALTFTCDTPADQDPDFGQCQGTLEDDEIIGTEQADIIRALSGFDDVFAGAGNDELNGGGGFDNMDAGAGEDELTVATSATAWRAKRIATLTTAARAQTDSRRSTNSTNSQPFRATTWRTAAPEATTSRRQGQRHPKGPGGRRSPPGEPTEAHMFGDPGNDELYGGTGDDSMEGEEGRDRHFGGPDNDFIDAASDETLASDPRDLVDCGDGHDTALVLPNDVVGENCEDVFNVFPGDPEE